MKTKERLVNKLQGNCDQFSFVRLLILTFFLVFLIINLNCAESSGKKSSSSSKTGDSTAPTVEISTSVIELLYINL